MMNFLKKNWKNILLIFFIILTIANCTGKGNYRRKYNKEVERIEYVKDSLSSMYGHSARCIDSLNHVIIRQSDMIRELNARCDIYDSQIKRANESAVRSEESARRLGKIAETLSNESKKNESESSK